MRKILAAGFSILFLQLAFPAPSYAWWEWLEELSGPGRWKGFDIDARLFCLVDNLPPEAKKTLVGQMQAFVAKTQKGDNRPRIEISTQLPSEGQQRLAFMTTARSEVRKWTSAFDEGERILDQWQQYAGGVGDKTAALRLAFSNERARAESSLAAVVSTTDSWTNGKAQRTDVDAAIKEAEQNAAQTVVALQRTAESIQHVVDRTRVSAAALPGVIYSACRLQRNERRRASFDVGMRFLWTHDDRYANGQRISFTTIEPAFAWNIFDNPDRDFMEYGVGAGFYWVTSKEFPSVTGGFLEPIRFDFHAPTNFAREDAPLGKKILRSLVFRTGYLVFPGGFDRAAFHPSDPVNQPETLERIGRDWVRYYGIYVDFEAFRKKT